MTTSSDARPDRPGVERRSTLATGLVLILVGAGFLVARAAGIDLGRAGWPLFVIVPGIILVAVAFAVGGRAGTGFAVGGAITTTTGLLLAFQNETGLWATWAYAWALVVPGGVGVGLLLYGGLTGQRDLALGGAWAALVGLALFLVGAFFFESVIGLSGDRIAGLDTMLAAGLVAVGLAVVAFGLGAGRREPPRPE